MDTPLSARAMLLLELTRGPGFGQALAERIRQRCGATVGEGSLYPALASLRRVGLVAEAAGEQNGNGRPRRYYTLTQHGEQAASETKAIIHAIL